MPRALASPLWQEGTREAPQAAPCLRPGAQGSQDPQPSQEPLPTLGHLFSAKREDLESRKPTVSGHDIFTENAK